MFLYGSSVILQVVALYRALQLPREIQEDHRHTINLAVIGLVIMFVGFLSTIVIDVLEESPVNTPTGRNMGALFLSDRPQTLHEARGEGGGSALGP